LLRTTFNHSHRSRRPSLLASLGDFQSFSEFLSSSFFIIGAPLCPHLLLFLGNNIWQDPVVAYATFYVIDCIHARILTGPRSGSEGDRSISNFCPPCFRFIAKVFVHIMLMLSSYSFFSFSLSLSLFLFSSPFLSLSFFFIYTYNQIVWYNQTILYYRNIYIWNTSILVMKSLI